MGTAVWFIGCDNTNGSSVVCDNGCEVKENGAERTVCGCICMLPGVEDVDLLALRLTTLLVSA